MNHYEYMVASTSRNLPKMDPANKHSYCNSRRVGLQVIKYICVHRRRNMFDTGGAKLQNL